MAYLVKAICHQLMSNISPPNGIYVSFKLGESQDQISPVVLGSVLDAMLWKHHVCSLRINGLGWSESKILNSCSQGESLKGFGTNVTLIGAHCLTYDQFQTKMNRVCFPSGNNVERRERYLRERENERIQRKYRRT